MLVQRKETGRYCRHREKSNILVVNGSDSKNFPRPSRVMQDYARIKA